MKTTDPLPIAPARFRALIAVFSVSGLLALNPLPLHGQAAADADEADVAQDEPVVLSPFVVDSTQDRGYQATSTLAGTRIRTNLADVGSAISVLTREMISDIGGYNNETVLAYAVNTEVAGPRGNFSGANRSGREGNVEEGSFTNPNGNTRVRGLVSADNTRDFFLSDVPWDSYNISRVDLQRGPNAILFGLGSPAGVINAATNLAQFRNQGSVEATFDKHGSQRYVLDYNRNVIDKQLALRIALLNNDRKFQQEPAFSRDRRAFAALKFAPAALNRRGTLFEISGNFEHGVITSNRPRSVPPQDRITPFWKPITQGGVGKRTFDLYRDPQAEFLPDATPDDDEDDVENPLWVYEPVLTNGLAGGSVNQIINSTGNVIFEREGLQAFGARTPTGEIITEAQGPDGAGPFPQNTGLQSLAGVQTWSGNAGLPYSAIGAYKNESITDPSIFDFYHRLIDGPNKREWSNWNVHSVDLTNTFFDNMVGYNVTYFRETMKRGQWTALGWEGNALHIDINERRYDNSLNPDVGRAFIGARLGDMGSYTSKSDRDAYRAQGFLAYDFEKRHSDRGFVAKVLGEQRLTAVYSKEGQQVDTRNLQFANWDLATLGRFGPDATLTNPDVNPGFRYYVSGDARSAGAPTNLHASALDAPFAWSGGGTQQITWFDPTWTAPATVDPAAPWDNPLDPNRVHSYTYQQFENPANYRGWTTVNGQYVTVNSSADIGGMSARDYLTASASLTDFEVKSKIGVWQGSFWNRAVVGIYGYRKDTARKYEHVTSDRQHNGNPATGGADLSPTNYNYSNPAALVSNTEAITRNWSVMLHVNKLLGSRDVLPLNLRLYYNEGENFQPLAGRIDAFGLALPNPGGTTKDISVMLSTKDDRYSLRVTKYETEVVNATSTDGQLQNTWALEQALGADLGPTSSTPAIVRGYLSGRLSYDEYADAGGDADQLRNSIIPAWMAFEKELKTWFPEFVRAWMGPNSSWGTDSLETPVVSSPTGFVATEDSTSEGVELEFIANPTRNWRIAINGSKTESTRDKVPGENFRQVGEFVDQTFQTSDAGLAPVWWPQNTAGLRGVGPYPFFFRSDWLRVNALNGQSAGEIRKYRANLLTNYEFAEGRLRGFGVGAGYRWEDKSIIAYAPKVDETGTFGINLDAPFYAPREETLDLWLSYRRKLNNKLTWRIQLNVFNVGEKNRLVPLAAGVDAERLGTAEPTPTTVVPMKATSFWIREGMSWQITNVIEF